MLPEGSLYSALFYLEAGLKHITQTYPTIILLNTIWKYTRSILKIRGPCVFTPIWRNKYYKELFKLKDFCLWETKGVQYISQLFNGNILQFFTDIQDEFTIPRTQFFKYLQLRHAIQSENRIPSLVLVTCPLMRDVLLTEDRKGMISRVYSRRLHSTRNASKLPCRKGWEKDLGPIDGEQWELCLTSVHCYQYLRHISCPTYSYSIGYIEH